MAAGIEHQQAVDLGQVQHFQHVAFARVAGGQAGGVHQNHFFVGQQTQQILQGSAVMGQVGHHAQHASVAAQLLMRAHPVGVQGNQAHTGGAVGACAQACQFGGGGGFAHTGSANQGKNAAFFMNRLGARVCFEVALQNVHDPADGVSRAQFLGHAFQNGAGQRGGVARPDQLEHQVGMDRVLARLAQPGEGVEAVLNQRFHGMQLVHNALRHGWRLGLNRRCGWPRCRRANRCGPELGQWLGFKHLGCGAGGGHLGACRNRRWRLNPWGAGRRAGHGFVPAAQHAFAHIVLKRQGAHGQLRCVVFHLASGLGRGRRGLALRGLVFAAVGQVRLVQRIQGVFARGQHFHAGGGGAVGQNQGALTKGEPCLGQCFARRGCNKALDVHDAAPLRIGPMRMLCDSGISLWAST